jgi:hypothetical protein
MNEWMNEEMNSFINGGDMQVSSTLYQYYV